MTDKQNHVWKIGDHFISTNGAMYTINKIDDRGFCWCTPLSIAFDEYDFAPESMAKMQYIGSEPTITAAWVNDAKDIPKPQSDKPEATNEMRAAFEKLTGLPFVAKNKLGAYKVEAMENFYKHFQAGAAWQASRADVGWQDISTAPKDELIILGFESGHIYEGQFVSTRGLWIEAGGFWEIENPEWWIPRHEYPPLPTPPAAGE